MCNFQTVDYTNLDYDASVDTSAVYAEIHEHDPKVHGSL